jgi:hypothetical protein
MAAAHTFQLKASRILTKSTFHSAPQPNSALHADANIGYRFAILMPMLLPSALVGSGAAERSVRNQKPCTDA